MSHSKILYFLPGTMCDKRLWESLWSSIELNSDTCVKFVALSIPIDNSIENIVDHLADKIEDRANLIGFSLGGYLAAAIALKYPEKVARLAILSNLPCEMEPREIVERSRAINYIERQGYAGISEKRVHELLAKENRLPEHVGLIKAMDKDLGVRVLVNQLSITTKRENLLPRLFEQKDSVRFILGDQDNIWPIQKIQKCLQKDRWFQLDIIKDCGHMSPIEKPKEIARLLAGWF